MGVRHIPKTERIESLGRWRKLLFVCLSVCLSVCNPFWRQHWNLLSVDWEWQFLLRQTKKNVSFSPDWSLSRLLCFCSFEYRLVWLIRLHCLSVCGEYGFTTSINLLVDRWFHFKGSKVFPRLSVRSATCLYSWYSPKKLEGHVVFLLPRISNLWKDLFLLPLCSPSTQVWSLRCLFLNGSSILSERVESACVVCLLFSCLFMRLAPHEEASLIMDEG